MPTIAFHTLGCKLNFAESSNLLRLFKQEGFEERSFHEKADVYVINTCTVTAIAERKCKTAIRMAHRLNSNAVIAVIGCFSQVNAKEIEKIEGVNIILGNDDKNRLVEKVKSYRQNNIINNAVVDISKLKTFSPSISYENRTRGFLKVQDGCDYFCSYCEIPFARGRSRSCSIEEAVHYAEILEKENKKEVVLTGVNIGDFGNGTSETFFELIKALDKRTNIPRYRISSIEPDLLSKEIIDFCASSEVFMPHFHIPLQSGSNKVLKLMNRHYLREEFAEKVNYIHSIMPNAFIACDVMTGFNGETDSEFQSSYDFLNSLPLSFIHVFTYSARPDARAKKFDENIPIHIRRQRSEILQSLSNRKKEEFYKSNTGYNASVLWEETKKNGKMYGFSDNYIKCSRDFDQNLVNAITLNKLEELSDDVFIIK
ncbi:MAG: tRNA (N(6)-L-threonylcarbamoyladenosine(37)-C(2))-methylthiotransferase MtaB [Bacteroidales bacterium]|nr:tRNA (N(6)-L-threonylcarbamoyladenosine(37)-C(2))-methylthiotransferase MtaB [Bacteroidales bacterium]